MKKIVVFLLMLFIAFNVKAEEYWFQDIKGNTGVEYNAGDKFKLSLSVDELIFLAIKTDDKFTWMTSISVEQHPEYDTYGYRTNDYFILPDYGDGVKFKLEQHPIQMSNGWGTAYAFIIQECTEKPQMILDCVPNITDQKIDCKINIMNYDPNTFFDTVQSFDEYFSSTKHVNEWRNIKYAYSGLSLVASTTSPTFKISGYDEQKILNIPTGSNNERTLVSFDLDPDTFVNNATLFKIHRIMGEYNFNTYGYGVNQDLVNNWEYVNYKSFSCSPLSIPESTTTNANKTSVLGKESKVDNPKTGIKELLVYIIPLIILISISVIVQKNNKLFKKI